MDTPSATSAAFEPLSYRREIFASLVRRTIAILVAVMVVDVVVAAGLGRLDFVRWPLAVFAVWIVSQFAFLAWVRRVRDAASLDRILFLFFALDLALCVVEYWANAGGWWAGPIFIGIIVVVAVTVLEGWAVSTIVGLATAAWALLVGAQVFDIVPVTPWGDFPSLKGHLVNGAAAIAFGTVGIAGLVILQRSQVRQVKQNEERWRLLVQTAPDLIFTLDPEAVIRSVNDTVVRETGFPREALEDRPYLTLVDGDADIVREQFARVLAGDPGRFEHRYRRADGSAGWLQASAASVGADGRAYGLLVTARDVTSEREAAEERERLQQELAQAQRMQAVGRLVSGVAHEINNPLTAILAITQQLREEEPQGERRDMLSMVHRQALRSRDIVRDLLAVVRRREDRPVRAIAWGDVLAGLEGMLRAEVERLGARLTVSLATHPTLVHADPIGLEQVVTNLVLNAAQAAGKGGVVTVREPDVPGAGVLVVEDDGPGIPADALGRIFEPFYTTKPEGEGTGLGLSVSLGIVEQAGGVVAAENRTPQEGGGARFTVTLPAVGTDESPTPSASAAAFRISTPGSRALAAEAEAQAPAERTVLLVDDEAVIRLALSRYFSRQGWRVLEAPNGDVALSLLRRSDIRPDVIVCDLRMPGAGGIELHDFLAEHRPELLERLIISTGDVASPDAAAFVARTACAVLEKPFDLAKLGDTVTRLLARVTPLVG